jgi:propionate CoA-transferase
MKGIKLISADAAARLIQDNNTVVTSGFVGVGVPEELTLALEKRFLASGSPRNLPLINAAGQGDGQTKG